MVIWLYKGIKLNRVIKNKLTIKAVFCSFNYVDILF